MLKFKEIKWNSTVNLIILLVVGLLLLIFPLESLKIASYLIASMLTLGGATYIIRIIKKRAVETNSDLITIVAGIVSIAIGITIFINPTWLVRAINVIIGLFIVINSIINIVSLFKFKKDRTKSWWITLSLIAIILILGIFVIVNPEFLASIIVRLEGATLVIDTLLTMILTYKIDKYINKIDKNIKEVKVVEEKTIPVIEEDED